LHVAHGWDAEEAFILPIEVGGVKEYLPVFKQERAVVLPVTRKVIF